jgi:hypothetical protein
MFLFNWKWWFRMIGAVEIYDSLDDGKLLEVRFVMCNSLKGNHFDCNLAREEWEKKLRVIIEGDGKDGYGIGRTLIGRTFRTTEGSMRRLFPGNYVGYKEALDYSI